jgi:VanZ family protein
VSLVARWRLRRRRPDVEIITRNGARRGNVNSKAWYRWMLRALVVYIVVMVAATHVPIERTVFPDTVFPWADKLAHVGIYCGLSFLLGLVVALRNAHRGLSASLSSAQYAWIAAGVAIYAAADEFTQPWTGRDRDLLDWIADVLGLGLGLVLFAVVERFRNRRRQLAL